MVKPKDKSTILDWLSDGGYTIKKFYTRATDSKGHSSLLHARMTSDLVDMIAKIVQSKKIPEYITHQDVIRDALFHRLKYLEDGGDIAHDDVLTRIQATEEFMIEEQRKLEYENSIVHMDKVLQSYIGHGEVGMVRARQVLEEIKNNMSQIKDNYWRTRYQDALAKYDYLLH